MQFDTDKDGPNIVRGVIVGSGLLGLAVIARSIRMFTTFHHLRQIPDEFFRKQMTIRGTVSFITDKGLLRIEHKPIAKIPFSKYFSSEKSEGKLTVSLAGLDLNETGADWLKKHALLKPVWITLIKKQNEDVLMGDVYLKRGRFFKYSLNKEMVRMGIGRVPSLDDKNHVTAYQVNPAYSRLVHELLLCEKYADKRGVGMWKKSMGNGRRQFFEQIYSFWFFVSEPFRVGLFSRFFSSFLTFFNQTLIFTANALKFGLTKSVQASVQAKHLLANGRK